MEFNFETLPLFFLMIDDSFIQSYLATSSAAFGELPFLHKILLDRASPSSLRCIIARPWSSLIELSGEREREKIYRYTTFPSSIASKQEPSERVSHPPR